MNDLRKAAEMALEALEDIFGKEKKDVGAINALRQALDDKPAVKTYAGGKPNYCTPEETRDNSSWVGLTDDEIVDLALSVGSYKGLVQAVETKLKEKNHG